MARAIAVRRIAAAAGAAWHPPFRQYLERDWTQPYAASDAVEQAWLTVYRDPQRHWDLHQLGEELTDLETPSASGASATSPRWSA